MRKIRQALISVSDKNKLQLILRILNKFKIKIISSGGTYKEIKRLGYQCKEVSKFTNSSELLEGRVKTLHPKIHAGILARRDQDMEILQQRGYETIDLVVVNLYPFKETIAQGCSFDEAIEKIDKAFSNL